VIAIITKMRSVVQSVFVALAERIEQWCNDILCSIRRVEFTGAI